MGENPCEPTVNPFANLRQSANPPYIRCESIRVSFANSRELSRTLANSCELSRTLANSRERTREPSANFRELLQTSCELLTNFLRILANFLRTFANSEYLAANFRVFVANSRELFANSRELSRISAVSAKRSCLQRPAHPVPPCNSRPLRPSTLSRKNPIPLPHAAARPSS